MLIRARRAVRLAMSLVLTVAASLAVVAVFQSAASADVTCGPNETRVFVPPSSYVCQSNGGTTNPGTGPVDGGGGGTDAPAVPTCNLDAINGSDYDNPSAPYCAENKTCVTVDLFAPVALPDGEKPNDDSKARVRICSGGPLGSIEVGTAFWSDDEKPPTRLEQALTAIGQIDLATPTVNVSPAGRTLVNLDTWFWLTGAQQEATGSSAFGLVAIATFRSMTVDPGDGSGTFTCPFTADAATAEKQCLHEYRRSSARGSASVDGRSAFTAKVNTVYDLRFEVGGAQVDVQGAPATLPGPPASAAIRVDEVQTLSRPNR